MKCLFGHRWYVAARHFAGYRPAYRGGPAVCAYGFATLRCERCPATREVEDIADFSYDEKIRDYQ